MNQKQFMKANLVCREDYPIGYQANCHQPHGVNENHTTGHSGSLEWAGTSYNLYFLYKLYKLYKLYNLGSLV